jgi:uncharacterized protein with GYD domain
MIRVVSLVNYTEEGMRQLGDLAESVTHVRKTVNGNGGKLEQAWATAGRYDAVAVLNFPDLEAEFRSRNEVYKMGLLRAEHLPAIPIEQAVDLAR